MLAGPRALGPDPRRHHEADPEHRPCARHLVQDQEPDRHRDRGLQAHERAEGRGGQPAQREHLEAERHDRQQDREADPDQRRRPS